MITGEETHHYGTHSYVRAFKKIVFKQALPFSTFAIELFNSGTKLF